MTRHPDWQSRLAALLGARAAEPFAWGSNDCALFAAAAVQAITGRDLAGDLRGAYASEVQAARVLEAHGGLAAIAAARLGAEVAPLLARVGDVVLGERERGSCLGVCTGEHWHVPSEQGLLALPMALAARAWRVG